MMFNKILWDVPSGNLLHSELENQHVLCENSQNFDWAIFNGYVTNYQRVDEQTYGGGRVDSFSMAGEKWWEMVCYSRANSSSGPMAMSQASSTRSHQHAETYQLLLSGLKAGTDPN